MTALPLDQTILESFRADGVVCLRGVFSGYWLDVIRSGVERNLRCPGPRAQVYAPGADSDDFFANADNRHFVSGPFVPGASPAPRYYNDCTTWRSNPEYRRFIFGSSAAAIAPALLGGSQVSLFFEDILVKEAEADAPTPWHQDVPMWPILGRRALSIWMPLDPVRHGNSVEFVRGSHRWGAFST